MARGFKTGGRPPGGINKATKEARAAIAKFVNSNAHRLQTWLDAIADGQTDKEGNVIVPPNPTRAFELFQSVIEYHVPKLARMELEHSGEVTHVSELTPEELAGELARVRGELAQVRAGLAGAPAEKRSKPGPAGVH